MRDRVDNQEHKEQVVPRAHWEILDQRGSRVPLARVELLDRQVQGVKLVQQAALDLRETLDHLEAKVSKVQQVLRVRGVRMVNREQPVNVECLVCQVTLVAQGHRVLEVRMGKLEPQALRVPQVHRDLLDQLDQMANKELLETLDLLELLVSLAIMVNLVLLEHRESRESVVTLDHLERQVRLEILDKEDSRE
jgi:hypothetical protein